jgi:transketolase
MDHFYLLEEAVNFFRQAVPRGAEAELAWHKKFEAYRQAFPSEANELDMILKRQLPDGWDADIPVWMDGDKSIATRAAGGQVINAIAKHIPNLAGGSADLNPSTNTAMHGLGNFQPVERFGLDPLGAVSTEWSYAGRNMAFGVREHVMGATANGMAAHGGVLPFTATFFSFFDYMKPAVRLAALSDLKVIFVFTHDSLGLGEDGPTHQPIEYRERARHSRLDRCTARRPDRDRGSEGGGNSA